MIAVIVDPQAPHGFRVGEVPEPKPSTGQVLIEVHAASLNRGDINDARSGRLDAGAVLGSDVAGVIARTAPGAPPVGTPVVALVSGAFAKRVVADVEALAVIPDGVEPAVAATLPVAGLAAIQALRAGTLDTPVKAARVLITGAGGGVGRFAVQLAALGGAHVIAVTSRPEPPDEQPTRRGTSSATASATALSRAASSVSASATASSRGASSVTASSLGGLRALGADQVVADPSEITEPVDLVLDTVGGRQLVTAWQLLAPGGSCQCIGWSSGEPASFPPYSTVGGSRTLNSFQITAPVGPDLESMLRLVEEDRLQVEIGWRGPLARISEAVETLRDRRLTGKAVLTVR